VTGGGERGSERHPGRARYRRPMRDLPIVLLGLGSVGRTFVEVIAESEPQLRRRFGFAPRIVAIRRSGTEARIQPGGASDAAWLPARGLGDLLADAQPWVVVQAMPGDRPGATAALDAALAALATGAHLVTATKSHLVTHWSVLDSAARSVGRAIRVSGATGAALPAGDMARRGTRALGCIAIRASLNGTSNHVLNELARGGALDAVLAEAVAAGIAEPDPTSDLGGHDAAAKLVILANLAWGLQAGIGDVEIEPITAATGDRALAAVREGRALRQVATARIDGGRMSVRLEAVGADDALHRLPGPEKAVEFDCGQAGRVVVSGGRSSPRGAALAMLKDVVNLATGDEAPGLG
jgi:homoserine dehydrogenase